jgi:hypothetical protein
MITSNAPCSPPKLSSLFINQKLEQMKWMARWQEQEDGMRNFSIIELAKEW